MNRLIIAKIFLLVLFLFAILCGFQSGAVQDEGITTKKEQKVPTPPLPAL
jgi:hypothetical protein